MNDDIQQAMNDIKRILRLNTWMTTATLLLVVAVAVIVFSR